MHSGKENRTNHCMAHHLYLGLSMGRVCAQPRTNPTTSSGRVTDRHRSLKTTGRLSFDSGGWRSVSVETNVEQQS